MSLPVRYSLLVLVSLVGLLQVRANAQRRSVDSRPNVLMIITDDCNCDLACYGHKTAKTPHIDRLAEQGVRFQHAYCQYPVCNPSRSSFMTSLYPDQTGVLSNAGNFRKRNPNVVTLSQMFRNQGYTAARVGKIYHYGVPRQIGTDGEDDLASWDLRVNPRGIDREVHDRIQTLVPGQFGGTLSWLNLPSRAEQHTDGVGATEAIRLLQTLHPDQTGRPFFLAVGFYRPHTPYVAPSEFFDLHPQTHIVPVLESPGDRDDIPLAALHDRPKQRELSIERRKEIIQAYYASISLMDQQVGRLVAALKSLNLSDRTIIVFASDHGYHLGQHGLWQKSDLFEGSCRVPLIISDPRGTTHGEVSNSLVELVDLYPTLADLCELTAPDHVRGRSLVPVLRDPQESIRQAALTVTVSRAANMHRELPRGRRIMGYSIRTKRYRYTEWEQGEFGRELYDYQSDPEEYHNLADRPESADVQKRLKELLDTAVQHAT